MVLSSGQTAFMVIPMISASLSMTTLILAAKFLPESLDRKARDEEGLGVQAPKRGLLHAFTFNHMALVVAIVFMISAAFAAMEATLPLWSKAMLGWGPEEVGYLLVVAGVVAVIAQGGLIGPLTRIFGEPKVVILAGTLLFAGMAGGGDELAGWRRRVGTDPAFDVVFCRNPFELGAPQRSARTARARNL